MENVAKNITEVAKEVVGFRMSNKNNRQNNSGVQKLSEEQKEIRLQISTCKDTEKREELKLKRNKIMHKIKTMLEADKEIELNHKIDDIEKTKDNTKMFKAVQELSRKKYENPFVHDESGRKVTNPQEIYNIVKKHFRNQFSVDTQEYLESFDGPPRTLNNKITVEEVEKIVKNNRASSD